LYFCIENVGAPNPRADRFRTTYGDAYRQYTSSCYKLRDRSAIIEHEQEGAERARYGESLLRELSASLTREFGKGFSLSNLKYMRRFYLFYRDRTHQIGQTVSGQLAKSLKSQTMSGKLNHPLLLSWSHYVFLLSLENPDERNFYEIEAAAQGWSLRELKRQFASSLYERLALSRDKDEVLKLSTKGQIVDRPRDLLKNPYVLEFLGLDEKETYSETDLETAIIDKVEHFLLSQTHSSGEDGYYQYRRYC